MTTKPTDAEFKVARREANYEGEHGEDAYQVCRWYRGQVFLRERAERWLVAHRIQRDMALAYPEGDASPAAGIVATDPQF